MYSIGDISKQFNLSISTIRYYDKEGLLKNINRSDSGIRIFTDKDLETFKIIECLKMTGMKIKDIKTYLDWCVFGDETIEQRRAMFIERRSEVEQQIQELQKVLSFIEYKCWYYDEAIRLGTTSKIDPSKYNDSKK